MNLSASADAANSSGARPNIVPHTARKCSCRTVRGLVPSPFVRCRLTRPHVAASWSAPSTGRQSAVTEALDQVAAMVPALLFLCVGVPLAALLDQLGYFEALASWMQRRAG